MEEEEVTKKIYPRLTTEMEPSAPTIEENIYTDMNNNTITIAPNNYRLEHINKVKDYLERTSENRRSLSKKYSKVINGLNLTNYGLNFVSASSGIAGVSTLSTIVLIPVSITLGGVSALTSFVSIGLSKLNKKLKVKEIKHRQLHDLCEFKLATINSLLSKALNDCKITDEEFQMILKEESHFRQSFEHTRREKNKKFAEEEFKEKGRNGIRESISKLIKRTK